MISNYLTLSQLIIGLVNENKRTTNTTVEQQLCSISGSHITISIEAIAFKIDINAHAQSIIYGLEKFFNEHAC